MARLLTVPEDLPDAFQQGITLFQVKVPHIRNVGDTEMELDKPGIFVKYNVTTWDSAGKIIDVKSRGVMFEDWPAGFKTDMKEAYAKLELDAENAGLLYGPGTDEPME